MLLSRMIAGRIEEIPRGNKKFLPIQGKTNLEVNEEKVAEARARLEASGYDSEEVRETIADRLLDQFGI